MAKPYLEIQNLSVAFRMESRTVHAVSDISYSVKAGESVGIVGESGSGKSVSMLAVMRLLPVPPATVSGHIWRDGRDLLAMSSSEIRDLRGNKIAMVFQDPMTALNPVLTIGRQMMEPLQIHLNMSRNAARQRAIELLELVGIPNPRQRINSYPHQFSGGMRQRVMIAMALTCNPDLLIADEPTTALDVTIQAQIVSLVKRLRAEFNMALVWISHDLGVVAGLVDRVLVMYAGRVVEEASVDDLFDNPQHPYTLGLLGSLPQMSSGERQELEVIAGSPPDLTQLPIGCSFAPRCQFVKEICTQVRPPLMPISDQQRAACWVDLERNAVDESRVDCFGNTAVE